MIDVDRAAMALMDKMSTDGHEVNYTQCREYAALAVFAATDAISDEALRLGFTVEQMMARRRRIQSEPFPQFGHAGRHNGSGAPDCPRTLHHHHDEFCQLPTMAEWALAGRTDDIKVGSRA